MRERTTNELDDLAGTDPTEKPDRAEMVVPASVRLVAPELDRTMNEPKSLRPAIDRADEAVVNLRAIWNRFANEDDDEISDVDVTQILWQAVETLGWISGYLTALDEPYPTIGPETGRIRRTD